MKKTSKILFTLFTIMLLTAILALSASAAEGIKTFSVNAASAENALDHGAVKWYKASDGNYYLFLPTGTDRSSMTVWFNADANVLCNGTKLENGKKTTAFAQGDTFTLTCGDKSYTLNILGAENSGTVYIKTESGNMAAVHADKSHKESGTIIIIDGNGVVQYDGDLDYIKGRGNSTWLANKKPYNIKLDSKANIFGMGKHKSWCLLSNPGDASLSRNMLCYDLATALGVEYTTDSYSVNLYLNGEYAGLYLVTEKVDIGENRIDIHDLEGETEDVNEKDLDEYSPAGKQNSREFGTIKYASIPRNPSEITGGYLLETEKIYRYVDEVSGFITDIGQAVVVKTPEYATKAQVEYISSYYQDFEDALYSRTGYNKKGMHYSEYIDVESFARMYIMLEFTANFDGCSSSFYMYKDVDGKLRSGPAWDFDNGLGQAMPNDLINHVPNVADPNLLYIQTCFIGNHAENRKSLLGQMFTHNDFQETVEKIWNEVFVEYYPEFRSSVEAARKDMMTSGIMNCIRWSTFGTTSYTDVARNYNAQFDSILSYIDSRYPVLNKAYSADTSFVKYDIGEYGKALVHDQTIYTNGSEAKLLKAPSSTDKNIKFAGWSTDPNGEGKLYAAGDKFTVNENTVLYAQWEDPQFVMRFFDKLAAIFSKVSLFFSEYKVR